MWTTCACPAPVTWRSPAASIPTRASGSMPPRRGPSPPSSACSPRPISRPSEASAISRPSSIIRRSARAGSCRWRATGFATSVSRSPPSWPRAATPRRTAPRPSRSRMIRSIPCPTLTPPSPPVRRSCTRGSRATWQPISRCDRAMPTRRSGAPRSSRAGATTSTATPGCRRGRAAPDALAYVGSYARGLGVLCPSITAASLPGPYRIRDYTCRVRAALTCKAPAAAYRGAGQPEAVFAVERAVDQLAQELGMDPAEVRRKNFIRRDEFPWELGLSSAQVPVVYDSGDYEASLDAALKLARYPERRAEHAAERARGDRGRLLGIGVAGYVLLTGLGPHEGAMLRVDPTGQVLLVTGASPHGQGTATALAQVVADELGLEPRDVVVRHGDTAMIPFGVGTYASRNAVVAGSAALVAARAVADKARRLAAHRLEVAEGDLELAGGAVRVVGAPHRRLSLGEIAAACAPGSPLPEGMRPGLEVTHYFLAPRPTFGSGVHVAVVAVDRDTGGVEVVDYVAASDAGRLINPLIVEGQLHGGVAQGVGGALYEELVYDEHGQPRAQSLMEYVMPTAGQIPAIKIANLVTPSPLNPLGVKGVGEGGALAPPAAITAAVEDALRPFGAHIVGTPIRAEDVLRLMRRS